MSSIDFKQLAHQLMFDLNDEEVKDIEKEFDTLLQQLQLMEAVNTDGVEEMVYCFEQPTTYLRDDQVGDVLSQSEALANAPKQSSGHFLVPKVVK